MLTVVEFPTAVINVSEQDRIDQVRSCLARGLPIIDAVLPPNGRSVAIIGGGPSLPRSLADLVGRDMDIWALNGAHDWLLDRGIIPMAMVMLDARPCNAAFVQHPRTNIRYLIASQCHPSAFDALGGADVTVWHSGTAGETPGLLSPGTLTVHGGSTVGLKAMMLAHVMGYRDLHLFGFDSSYDRGDGHAYSQPFNDGEDIMPITVAGRTFWAAPWMAQQVQQFGAAVATLDAAGTGITVYGDGLLPWYAEQLGRDPIQTRVYRWEVLEDLIHRYQLGSGTVVELGCKDARTLQWLLRQFPDLRGIGIDAWGGAANALENYDGNWDHAAFRSAAETHCAPFGDRCRLICGITSSVAAEMADQSVDLVFIDADHTTAGCQADIDAWKPKLRPGGVMAGHDIDWPTVHAAVASRFQAWDTGPDAVWWVQC